MPIEDPIPHGALELARSLMAELSAAAARDPDNVRVVAALGHTAATVALLEGFERPTPSDA